MSESESQFTAGDVTIKVKCELPVADTNSIYPTLRFDIRFDAIQGGSGERIREVYLTNIKGDIFVGEKLSLGIAEAFIPVVKCYPPGGNPCQLYLKLDHYGLAQIEKFRAGGNLQMRARIYVTVDSIDNKPRRDTWQPVVSLNIPKSLWVEEILLILRYKEVLLVEIPKLNNTDFSDVTHHLQEAWKQQSMGAPDKVLTECRKALEGLSSKIKEAGYEKEEPNENGEKQKVPNWKAFFNNENIGDAVGNINKKLHHFVAPGAHYGKALSLSDSYFAIMLTHAILYYVINRFEREI